MTNLPKLGSERSTKFGQALRGRTFLTRKQRRQAREQEREQQERQAYWRDVASFVSTDDLSRRRAVRIIGGSVYGVNHRAVFQQR